MLRASPLHNVASRCFRTSSHDRLFTFSFLAIPFEFLTVIAAVSPFHSMRPSHSGKGGLSGRASPISYRHAFWLLEPELRTRIFICRWTCSRTSNADCLPIGPSLTRDLHRSDAPDRRLACPDLGTASIWAEARRTKIANIVALEGHTVRSRLAPCMQTVESYVRTQSPSVKEGCAALDPALHQQLRIKSPAPHPTDLGTARAASNSACHSSQR